MAEPAGVLDELASYLIAQSATWPTPLVAGTTLFAGDRPDQPDTLVALFTYSGPGPDRVLGGRAGILLQPRLQVFVRDIGYQAAEQFAWRVWNALEDLAAGTLRSIDTLTGAYYLGVDLVEEPYQLEEENQVTAAGARRHVFTFRGQVYKAQSA